MEESFTLTSDSDSTLNVSFTSDRSATISTSMTCMQSRMTGSFILLIGNLSTHHVLMANYLSNFKSNFF